MNATARMATVLLTGALVFLSASGAQAQSRVAQSPAKPRMPVGWRLGLTVGSQSESNARFEGTDGVSDVLTRLSAEAAGSLSSPRSRVEFSATGDMLRYRQLRDLDRFNFDFGVRAGTAVSPRLAMELDLRVRNASTLDITRSATENDAFLLPFTISRTQSIGSTATYKLSEATDATAEVSYLRSAFDAPDIVGGSILTGRLGLMRRYSADGSVGLLGDASFTRNEERSIDVATMHGSWSRRAKALQLLMQAGISGVRTSDSPTASFVPIGEAELRHGSTNGTFVLRYARSAMQTFGLGRALTSDQVSASHDRVWFSGLVVRLSADQAWIQDPTSPGLQLRASTLLAEARRVVAGGLWISAGGFVRRRSADLVIDNRGVLVTAGYTRTR